MSLGKLPGIKGLVSGSQGKRRFKSDLSVDMISPPLGDFRHTMHVGRGGDVFGDTSFLSNHGGNGEPGSPDSANSSKTTGFFTRTLRHVRKNSGPCPRVDSREFSPPPPEISPIIKNAISLPQLNVDSSNGCLQRVLFPSSVSSPENSFYAYGLQSGFVTLPRHSRLDRQLQDGDIRRGSLPDSSGITLTRSDSLTSFTVDLGPSLMTEVLSLIDNPSCLQVSNHSQAEREGEDGEEEEMSSVIEMPMDSPGLSSPNPSMSSMSLRGNMNNRGRSCSPDWSEQEEDRRSVRTPDTSIGSPQRVEPVMEAERFQRAADVLSRHYGGGSFTQGRSQRNIITSPDFSHSHKTPYAFSEEEEEIKV
ncbi:cdc42 effector protein 1-like [Myripristis murdjan]|uniref:cdc42 effector protein 1-like n=1 Tax=Myripristis murdjan TaxID=586833 RepID=UPI001175EC5C|nr:cdc42 effector protein 1-like [Myripristis murdjan]XP_029914503.1 cdc42 effector protein 1-like [Myripristis murdjan]XP_029914505.1 cdc42 effector protein 1-like [Myripristis murdjan]